MHQTQSETAMHLAETAVTDAQAAGNEHSLAVALHMRGITHVQDMEAAHADFEASFERFDAIGDALWAGNVQNSLGQTDLQMGDFASARKHLAAAYDASVALDNRLALPGILAGFGVTSLLDGDARAAVAYFVEAFLASRATDSIFTVVESALGVAISVGALGRVRDAAMVHGVCDAWAHRLHHVLAPAHAMWREHEHARLRSELGDVAFDIAYEEGYELEPATFSALLRTFAADTSA
jgi:hypothetical protein